MSRTSTGKVIKSTGSWYLVADLKTSEQFECRLRGKFRTKGIKTTNPVAVGDIVDFENETKAIVKIHPRTNYIIRKSTNLSKQSHIIAANIDQAVIIVSLTMPRTSTGFIDRLLITAEAYHIPTVIVFNKIDLLNEEQKVVLEQITGIYQNAGYDCLHTSVKELVNLEEFKELLHNKTSLLSGHSGVGKSALINTIDQGLGLKTGEISAHHSKGTHTTTFAEMFSQIKLKASNKGTSQRKFRPYNNRKQTRGRRVQKIHFKNGTVKYIVHNGKNAANMNLTM